MSAFALPFSGRHRELELVSQVRGEAAAGHGQLLLLSGDGGVGKTRLVQEAATAARAVGWQIAIGHAYPLETAIPYAAFADALGPLLAALDSGALMRLTRGDRGVMAALAPQLAERTGAGALFPEGVTPAEQRVRLHAAILQLLARLSDKHPLMLCLENLQWADSSSVELLHFLGRQLVGHKVLLIGSWNETDQPLSADFRLALRSLRGLGAANDVRLSPLTADDVQQMLSQHFAVDSEVIHGFASRLHHATQGNAFFIEQTLRELITRGDVRQQGGAWIGWHIESMVLPPSVRDVLDARLARLSTAARQVAEIIAVAGTTATHDVLQTVTTSTLHLGHDALREALDELREAGLIAEGSTGQDISYAFTHPMLQQALVQAFGLARERDMHATLALALENAAGTQADNYAEAIAAHWLRADPRAHPAVAVRWLTMAGRVALRRLARREAAASLRAALDRTDAHPEVIAAATAAELVDELARVYRRLAEYHEAILMSERARDLARAAGTPLGVAVAERRIGLSLQGLGRREDALQHFDEAIAIARTLRDDTFLVRSQLAKADCLQALGLVEDAKREVNEALAAAERLDQLPLLARAHRMLLLLHVWTGPAHRAWTHARSAVALAERSGERNLIWSAHYAAAVLAALTSNTSALTAHLSETMRLAQELASPLLELRTMEIALEYRAAIGEWDRALADGERALGLGRALDQTTLLARIAHWVSGVYMQRGDLSAAQRLVQEAWDVAGAAGLDLSRPFEVHGVLPAYVAKTRYLHAVGEHAQALVHGQTALAIADRTGYIAWAVYRLLPTMASAALVLGDRETLTQVRNRLEEDAERLAHPIGQAWVRVIDGERAYEDGRFDDAAAQLQRAIAALEAVPYPFDAAETRIRLARVLAAQGARHDAVNEAREALTMFEKLGARPAAEQARTLLRELGARLPSTPSTSLLANLTSRELEIVKLVAQRLSNKEIGARLGITARTAGTHLANVFDKLNVRDRTALGDLAREQGLHR
jgi:predicted ATPase/DNA-binding CsgD family transcriptional regulator